MGYKDPEKKRANDRAYREKNKEKLKKQKKEHYQKNKEAILQKVKKYSQEHGEQIKKYLTQYHKKTRLQVLAKVDPEMKCAMCGCDDTRFLEVNHIKGGGRKEQRGFKEEDHDFSHNIISLIYKGKRGVEDLNLLCRVCNSIDHLERVYGHTGLRVVWDKQVTK